ncbi:uncharacterized protein LOC106427326 isoform X1 [Brassica napus]|nr:uncharacterized protein LOC106427326 isoform X1 [Brassica napus]
MYSAHIQSDGPGKKGDYRPLDCIRETCDRPMVYPKGTSHRRRHEFIIYTWTNLKPVNLETSPRISFDLETSPIFRRLHHQVRKVREIMAGGGNFIGRVISYVANELIVNGLSNSHAFQRFAVRTSKRIENISKMAAESKEKVAQHMEELSKNSDTFKKP